MPIATDPASVARPSEGHRVAASGRTRAGRDGAEENSEGHRKGAEQLAAFAASLRDANQPGHLALAEFTRAPAATQSAFWAEVEKRAAASRAAVQVEEEEAAELGLSLSDFYARFFVTPEGRVRRGQGRIWSQRWRDRAYRDRVIEQRGRRYEPTFDSEKARLEAIEARDYVFRLTGIEANRAGYLHCPLPDHDERTPSFSCRDTRWRCYGCHAHGSIYELAGILWDLPRSGADFRRIHDRLIEVFP